MLGRIRRLRLVVGALWRRQSCTQVGMVLKCLSKSRGMLLFRLNDHFQLQLVSLNDFLSHILQHINIPCRSYISGRN